MVMRCKQVGVHIGSLRLDQLLIRLDIAIEKAVEEEIFTDEINNGRDDRF